MFPTSTLKPNLAELDPKIVPLVSTINEFGLPTYYSCEGHSSGNLIQSSVPLVVITPEASQEQTNLFMRFLGMVGMHNSYCRSSEDVPWMIFPNGNPSLSFVLKPLQNYQKIGVLHGGIIKLVDNLSKMKDWYNPK
ncbi:MAG: hypothetical protein AAB909_02280 [Patescibacteria group bacterium]